MGGMIKATTLCLFHLGVIAISQAKWAGSRIQESGEGADEKVRARVWNLRRHVSTSISGLLRSGITSKVPDHHSEK
jgi:hypothetical protein